ncbi:MAG: sugar ABC transporter ATP-binding protein [Lachnospiraceae bacterium]
MNRTIVEMDNIVKSFAGIKALNDVHLDLREGELHALMGENGAGKSTLMKILTGVYSKDSGTIKLASEDGSLKEVEIKTPLQAQHLGISMVFQEFNLLDNMDIAENIFLGREPVDRKHCIDKKKMYADAKKWLDKVHLDIDPKSKVSDLSVGFKQLLEIAKCLSFNARIIILDEPTASLTDRESETLFSIIDELKRNNISIVYISHRMEEVFNLADRITVFRDGTYIDTVERKNFKEDEIIKMMIGRELQEDVSARAIKGGSDEIALEVQNIKVYKNSTPVNLKLRKGEILGMFGLVGAGRTELSRVIFGIDPVGDGRILVDGKEIKITRPLDAIKAGIALVPEDRKDLGLILGMSVKDNMLLPKLGTFTSPVLNKKDISNITGTYIQDLSIALASEEEEVKNLSGGNQQKVVIAKWMAMNPKILIMDEPTRGIDIGAKSEIYAIMRKLTEEGMSIIMISSEMAEIQKVSDRVIVMHEGSVTGEMSVDEATQATIMNAAIGMEN